MLFFRKRAKTVVNKPVIRAPENDFGRAHRVSKIVHGMYKNEPWFRSTEISNKKDGPCIFLHVKEGSLDKDIAAFQVENIFVYPVCRKESKLSPQVDADYWGITRK